MRLKVYDWQVHAHRAHASYIHTWLAIETRDRHVNTNSTNSLQLRGQPLPSSLLEKNWGPLVRIYIHMHIWLYACTRIFSLYTYAHLLYLYTYTCHEWHICNIPVRCHTLNLTYMSNLTCHIGRVTCHTQVTHILCHRCVTCRLMHVACLVSHLTCHVCCVTDHMSQVSHVCHITCHRCHT